ncbi:prenyltransferase/squalene oxidase repeat-containing protein [Kitasatospora sp. NPDC088391]|uniref:prenyltransferase/squalene oxidase repeat-containing protein n=1 Tax=Kitasatospora sp. NPDC088391 TaxID=3364074 RepID=UPI00381F902D
MPTAARLGAAALTGALLTGVLAVPALADTASPAASPAGSPAASATATSTATSAALPAGLYGKGDPQYDGVWRQSLALLALKQEKAEPADSAVQWLLGQQCEDGGWPSYRAEGAPCLPATEDSNATAVAVQALTALGGYQQQAGRGVDWLRKQQNQDGSWAYNPGSPGDADSTALVINALLAAGADPASVGTAPHTAYDALAAFQLGCAAPAEQRGAFQYQPAAGVPAAPNTLASAQSLLAAAGGHLPVAAAPRKDAAPKAPACADGANGPVAHADSAEADAAWLTAQLAANGQHLMLTTPGAPATPDHASTAWAVLGLAAAGYGAQAAGAADWLAGNGWAWAAQGKDGTDPAAAATLVLAARAAQLDPYRFGGHDLVGLLTAAGPQPKSAPQAAASAPAPAGQDRKKDGGGFPAIWTIGVGLLIGAGAGLLLSLNRRRRNGGSAGQQR